MAKLYLVGTPIGNLGDLSPRAASVLESVDFIAAEDTRVTMKLLNHLGIKKPMISYYEHNLQEKSQGILDRIKNGENCAIVTDAGMPCISDPGELLVRLCHEQDIAIELVPGPSAVITAVAASGLATSRFCFEGFLSVNKNSRIEHLQSIQQETRTMVFYEAPHKLLRTLQDMLHVLGDRELVVCREMTKIHEEIWRTTLEKAVERYEEEPPKGEFVLVLAGKPEEEESLISEEEAVEAVLQRVREGESLTAAAKQVARETGYKKGDLYKKAIRFEE